MPAFLTGISLRVLLVAVGALLIGGGAFYVKHVISQNQELRDELSDAQAANRQNLATIDQLRTDYARASASLTQELADVKARASQQATIEQGIKDAQPKDDAPVAPVLRSTVERLYPNANRKR